jgi:hypothetical protein
MRAWIVVLAWLCAGCAVGGSGHPPSEDDATQQILVMLRLPVDHFRPDAAYAGAYGADAGASARHRIAERLARDHGLELATQWPMPVLGVDCFVMRIPAGAARERSPDAWARLLSGDARVAWVQPMHVYHTRGGEALAAHNDPLYPAQPAARAWRLSALHELATGRGVRVAVIDSGVARNHPDLSGQVAAAENFVDTGSDAAEEHGTAVAGIIAARADDGIGIAGVAPGARLLALRACRQRGAGGDTLCTTFSLAKALHYAITRDAEVVNMSLSGPTDRLLAQLIDAAMARHVVVVAARDPEAPDGGFPASHPGVWAATDDASRTRGGALVAPGRDVPTTVPGGWAVVTGASYAAAHVAGLAALLRELGGARSLPTNGTAIVLQSAGSIDTCATLLRVTGPRSCACADTHSRTAAAPATRPGLDIP